MGDKTRGIYSKFHVSRIDGQSAPGQKHDGCFYWVLDLDHDPYALRLYQMYADLCRVEYPLLAADIDADVQVRIRRLARIRISQKEIRHD